MSALHNRINSKIEVYIRRTEKDEHIDKRSDKKKKRRAEMNVNQINFYSYVVLRFTNHRRHQ